jgi:hypothetical protein
MVHALDQAAVNVLFVGIREIDTESSLDCLAGKPEQPRPIQEFLLHSRGSSSFDFSFVDIGSKLSNFVHASTVALMM